MTDKRIYQIGLTMINGVGDILARQLLQSLGDAEAIFSEKRQLLERIPGIGSFTAAEIKRPEVLLRAENELSYIEKSQISCYFLTDPAYPDKLRECPDAPILFYFKGNANLDATHIVSIVGTRKATDYGRNLVETFVKEMAGSFPDLLIVSGLAYGIDICAHRHALKNNLPTVGVLAHGLDRIYPSAHRETAMAMLGQGGLLTDFPIGTEPDKPNFIRRNRIVAGLADATVVIESAEKGGSLITADLAFSYDRDVFCFPGRVNDLHSRGCNNLIKENKAGLITSAADFIASLNWNSKPESAKSKVIQTELFFPENNQLARIARIIHEKKEVHINQLAIITEIPVHQLTTLLFELEMEGIIKILPGNIFKPV